MTTHNKLLHGSNATILALIAYSIPHFIEIKTDIGILKKQTCECRRIAAAGELAPDAKQPGAQTNLLAKATHEQ